MRFYDLSLTIGANASEPVPVEIQYVSHAEGAQILGKPLGLTAADWPDQMAISTETVSLSTHTGTHVDAPLHYGPLCEGRPSKSIAEVPLEWFYQDGVLLRFASGVERGPITLAEVKFELDRIGYTLKPLDIVLMDSGAARLWGDPAYFTNFRGVTLQATDWITSCGVKVIGIDSFGFDPPFHCMLETYQRTRSADDLWPAHVFGRRREYCQIERLAHLDQLPAQFGFKVSCFPMKVQCGGAGWTRAVALFEP
jgi:kynurenine formamidase